MSYKVTHEWITSLPTQLPPQKLDDCLEAIRAGDFVEVLLHDWGVSNGFEAYDDWRTSMGNWAEQLDFPGHTF